MTRKKMTDIEKELKRMAKALNDVVKIYKKELENAYFLYDFKKIRRRKSWF